VWPFTQGEISGKYEQFIDIAFQGLPRSAPIDPGHSAETGCWSGFAPAVTRKSGYRKQDNWRRWVKRL
jgi:hypothetical protein